MDINKERDLAFRAAEKLADSLISTKKLMDVFPESFVIIEQKDFVGGDFFFVHKSEYCVLGVVDCTGHSIEGVMSAVLFNGYLKEALKNHDDPKLILDLVNNKIQRDYPDTNSLTADLAVVKIDQKKGYLDYAGAMRPISITSGATFSIIKGSRVRIGDKNYNRNDIVKHRIDFKKGDRVYLMTDGLENQFGGEKDKRLRMDSITQWIKESQHIKIKDQKDFFYKKFKDFLGGNEIFDDISLVGVEL